MEHENIGNAVTSTQLGSHQPQLNKDPPSLKSAKSYDDWLKLLKIWKLYTTIPKNRQGQSIILSLHNEAQEAALELPEEDISSEVGVTHIIARLDNLNKKDDTLKKYNALEEFETYRRKGDITIQQLAKATLIQLTYKEMKEKLRNIFGECKHLPTSDSSQINIQDVNYTEDYMNTDFEDMNLENYENEHDETDPETMLPIEEDHNATDLKQTSDHHKTFYNRNQRLNRFTQNRFDNQNQNNFTRRRQYTPPGHQGNNYFRQSNYQQPGYQERNYVRQSNYQEPTRPSNIPTKPIRPKGRNPLSRCAICQSVNHWAAQCPDRESKLQQNQTMFTNVQL